MTFDQATIDSSGAFLVHELERLDQTLNLPLTSQTWSRDIQLREDVSIADEISSFTNTTFAAAGSPNANGKNWISPLATAIAGISVDIDKKGFPLELWGMELGWTIIELNAAAQVGRPIDTQKYDGMQLKWNMDTDEQVYIGDTAKGKGLLNLIQVTPTNATKTWATSTTDEIRASINQVLSNAWARSAYSKVPEDLLIPPEQYSFLASTIVSSAGNQSLLTYLETNTILPPERQAAEHSSGEMDERSWRRGTDRMVAYTNDKKFVRFPMVPLQSVPIQYRGLYQLVTYYGKLGAVEPVYPETLNYMDGI
jgi:hypothetical protein